MNYNERHAALVAYLKAKTQEADWHGVSDAANDLRVLEAKGPAETEPVSHNPMVERCDKVNTDGGWCMWDYGHEGAHAFV